MRAFEVGSVCVKTMGREAGKSAVVLGVIDDNFVVVQGPEVRKRKCNVLHLVPVGKKISVSNEVTQKELKEKLA
ncbi:MAG: 50S ribosomal protein L14e [Candidatus Diapherotrites archaeon]|uniref:50S ribosomal protein L14e n=1 Tax=Candidatus Iainarchaeum sp. TaxID=3101447 RepID=A0A8T3YPV2_9ARCH|nr:50S ribosomal protein L14e [Candidatus Diapherotrites archaeon]